VLISALGGEGGGVLADWIILAAQKADLPVQSTSIPGVAQRTGATTYYVEVFPLTNAVVGERRPVLGLYPSPDNVDVMISSELLEAGRALENGFVTGRTTLIAATHRVYATSEKMAMADGRADADRLLRAARELPKRAILYDLSADKVGRVQPLNAVLLGSLFAAGILPIGREAFEEAIKAKGVAVAGNLAGFDYGVKVATGEIVPTPPAPIPRTQAEAGTVPALVREIQQSFPAPAIAVAEEGVRRVLAYQNEAYARLYVERLKKLLHAEPEVVAEVARQLCLWMTYEDIIKVAAEKCSPERYARVRAEVRAKGGEPLHLTEHFKPGIEEVAALLPVSLGRKLQQWGERKGVLDTMHVSMHLRSTTVLGYARLKLLASLKGWRPRSYRFAEEQAMIERWLTAIRKAAEVNSRLALEIAELARLLKGYGDTHRRGRTNFDAVMTRIVDTLLAKGAEGPEAAQRVKAAREAALADPEGAALQQALAA
jgi:indolepyruvate ferredoxin oxidoreductase beta subunit